MSQDRTRLPTGSASQSPLTRRQSRRQERERRRQRMAILAVGGAVLLTLLLILVPFLKRSLWDPRQTVATVGTQVIRRAEYDKLQRLSALGLPHPSGLGQVFDAFQQNPEQVRERFTQQLEEANLKDVGVEATALDPIVDNAVLVETAPQAGINVSEKDVRQGLVRAIAPALANDQGAGAKGTPTAGAQSAAQSTAGPTGTAAGSTPAATPTLPRLPEDQVNDFFSALRDTTGVSRSDYERLVIRPAVIKQRFV